MMDSLYSSLHANVTAQGTRHLVEGTLQPIVRLFMHYYSSMPDGCLLRDTRPDLRCLYHSPVRTAIVPRPDAVICSHGYIVTDCNGPPV